MAIKPFTYSFVDTHISILGVGGNLVLSEGGMAGEGLQISMKEDKNIMLTGVDGSSVNSLIAHDAAEISITYFKTSPQNSALDTMFNLQKLSSGLWGANTISVVNAVSGDNFDAFGCAFRRRPTLKWGKEVGMMEWVFDVQGFNGTIGGGIVGNIAVIGANLI